MIFAKILFYLFHLPINYTLYLICKLLGGDEDWAVWLSDIKHNFFIDFKNKDEFEL